MKLFFSFSRRLDLVVRRMLSIKNLLLGVFDPLLSHYERPRSVNGMCLFLYLFTRREQV